jgi:diguanylate cyclase (GGDEF)-like protein
MQAVRDSDTVCRAGSDEFIILLSEIPKAADAAVSADRILVAIGADHRVEGHVIHTSASIGIAVYPDDGDDAELLVSHADAAMYVAKSRGRNNYQFYAAEEMAGRPKSDRVSA